MPTHIVMGISMQITTNAASAQALLWFLADVSSISSFFLEDIGARHISSSITARINTPYIMAYLMPSAVTLILSIR